MKKTVFMVFGIGCTGSSYPLAMSIRQSSAIGYAYMCGKETVVKSLALKDALACSDSFHIINLDK